MSAWIDELGRLADEYAEHKRNEGIYDASFIAHRQAALAAEEAAEARAALLAHAAQRDHTEDVLGMVQSVEQTPTPPTLASAARGVRSFLESTLRTNSKDVNDWREDVITAVKVLESIDGHGGNPSECPALLWQPTPPQSVELPEPDTHCYDTDEERDVWSHSPDQMRTYGDAREAAGYARGRADERERCAAICDRMGNPLNVKYEGGGCRKAAAAIRAAQKGIE